jgi:hypothetical protein
MVLLRTTYIYIYTEWQWHNVTKITILQNYYNKSDDTKYRPGLGLIIYSGS